MNSVAIIMGGASGIGRAVAEILARQGTTVVLGDINSSLVIETEKSITDTGGKAKAVVLDVTDALMVQKLVQDTVNEFGRLDYMFNNAGICSIGEVKDFSLADWEPMLRTNINGVIHGVNAAYPIMIKQGFGHIINTASLAGLIPNPLLVAYSLTKHAIVGLSTSLRAEAAQYGVKISVICPDYVDTPIRNTSRFIGIKREDADALADMVGIKYIPLAQCAQEIMRGIAKNKAIIIIPAFARLTSLVYRLFPSLVFRLTNNTMKKLHKIQGK
jgi:short-subunit dehydrogenase